MKTSADVFDGINALEARFPVQEWRCGDIDLWPTYRFRLHANSMDKVLLNDTPTGFGHRLRGLADRASRALLRVPMAALRDMGMNAAVRSGTTAVFFSDGVSFVRLGNSWCDRIMDPPMQALAERGHRSLKLTPLAEAHVPRHVPSRFVQPAIDRIKLTASRPSGAMVVPQFESFHAAACDLFGSSAPSLQWLRVQAARLDALARWFGRSLRRTGASHAFVNTYYSLEGLAFVLAARRGGLRSIDLQHGIQGPHHIAYARWSSVPRSGYSTLPDEFWVWGAEEASTIDAWRSRCARHVPRITGNYWAQRWRDSTDPLVESCVAEARALCASQRTDKQVLVCLSWGIPEEETDKLIEAAKLCGPSIRWWWRMHPARTSQWPDFARRLQRHGLDGSLVRQATDLPLYALLRVADLAIAHSSTSIKDAAEMGVPAVVTSDYGVELHADLVQRGVVLRATDARAIAGAVMTLASRPRPVGSRPAADGNSLAAALDAAFLPTPAASARQLERAT